jgi:hypothetical protein
MSDQPREQDTGRFSFVTKDRGKPIDWSLLEDLTEQDRQFIDASLVTTNRSFASSFGEDIAMIDAEYADGQWSVRGAVQYSSQCQDCYGFIEKPIIARVRDGDPDPTRCLHCGATLQVMHDVSCADANASIYSLLDRAHREILRTHYRELDKQIDQDALSERAGDTLDALLDASPRDVLDFAPYELRSKPGTQNHIGLRLNMDSREIELVVTCINVCSKGRAEATQSEPIPDDALDVLLKGLESSKFTEQLSPDDLARMRSLLLAVREWRKIANS